MARHVGCGTHRVQDAGGIAGGAVGAETDFDVGVEQVADSTPAVAETGVGVGVVGDAGAGRSQERDVGRGKVDAVCEDGPGMQQSVASVHLRVV